MNSGFHEWELFSLSFIRAKKLIPKEGSSPKLFLEILKLISKGGWLSIPMLIHTPSKPIFLLK